MDTVPVHNQARSQTRDPVAAAPVARDTTPAPAAQARQAARSAEADNKTRQLEKQLSQESLQKLFSDLGQQVAVESRSLSFVVNEDIGRTIVSVIDRETEELIRQIPSEEIVRVAKALQQFREESGTSLTGSGLLLDEQA